jgi:hypothetical protein
MEARVRHITPRSRSVYAALVGVVIVLGLATRRYRSLLPPTAAGYLGDALWAVMVFLVLALALPSAANRDWPLGPRSSR